MWRFLYLHLPIILRRGIDRIRHNKVMRFFIPEYVEGPAPQAQLHLRPSWDKGLKQRDRARITELLAPTETLDMKVIPLHNPRRGWFSRLWHR